MKDVRRRQAESSARIAWIVMVAGALAIGLSVTFLAHTTTSTSVRVTAGPTAFDMHSIGWNPRGDMFAVVERGQGLGDVNVVIYSDTGIGLRRVAGGDAAWIGDDEIAVVQPTGDDSEHGRLLLLTVSTDARKLVDAQFGINIVGSADAHDVALPLPGDGPPAYRLLSDARPRPGIPLAWDRLGRHIAVAEPDRGVERPGTPVPLAIADRTGVARRMTTPIVGLWATFSPDGSQVAACLSTADGCVFGLARVEDGGVTLTDLADPVYADALGSGAWLIGSLDGAEVLRTDGSSSTFSTFAVGESSGGLMALVASDARTEPTTGSDAVDVPGPPAVLPGGRPTWSPR